MLKININLIFTVINVIIIYIVLNKMLFKKKNAQHEKRAAAIDKEFELAANKQREADQLKSDYEQQLAGVEAIKQDTLREARAQADEEARLIKEAAESDAEQIRANAAEQAEATKDQVLRKAEQELADLVMSATNKVAGGQKGADFDKALLDEFISEAGDKE